MIGRCWGGFESERDAARWAAAVRRRLPGVTDVVLAYRSAAVFIDPDQARPDAVGTELAVIELGPPDEAGGRLLTIPVLDDGPHAARRRLGLDGDRVIEIHTSVDYDVYAIGFLPGFPYAGGPAGGTVRPARAARRPG